MKKILPALIVLTIFGLSGCIEMFFSENNVIYYSKTATTIVYNISYGYHITSAGHGKYTLRYTCPILCSPLNGSIFSTSILYHQNYSLSSLGKNDLIEWTIDGRDIGQYDVGIEAELTVTSFVTGLNSSRSLSIDDIPAHIKDQYCRAQSISERDNGSSTPLIDPENSEIAALAMKIKGHENNAFLVAKNLFVWLKNSTSYKSHPSGDTAIQSAVKTLHMKTGDCDDLSFLYISLCRAADIPARFVRGYLVEKNVDGSYYAVPHAWAEVFVGFGKEGWIPVECAGASHNIEAEIHQNFGIEDCRHIRIFVDDGSNESLDISVQGPSVEYQIGEMVDMQGFVTLNKVEEIDYGKLTIYSNGHRAYT